MTNAFISGTTDYGPITLRAALDFAVEAAWQAGKITLEYFQTDTAVEHKSDASPVTLADRRAEEKLRERIQHVFPDHGILGEEFGEIAGHTPYRWVLDPLDGTRSFIQGVPLYGVMMGLEYEGRPIPGSSISRRWGIPCMPPRAKAVTGTAGGRRSRASAVWRTR